MYELLRSILLLPILLLILAHFILLTIRLEHVSNLSLFIVTIPADVAYGGGTLLFLGLALFLRKISNHDRILMGALVSLLLGSLISQLLIARKVEVDYQVTWWASLLPFEIGVLLASILVLAALLVKRAEQKTASESSTQRPRDDTELIPKGRSAVTSQANYGATYTRQASGAVSVTHLQANPWKPRR